MRQRFCSPAHRQIAEWACPQGWDWTISLGGHIRWTHPQTPWIVYTSATPSDSRAFQRVKRDFKRAMRFGLGRRAKRMAA